MAVYSDLSYDFELEVDGNIKLVTDLDSINQALRTLFFTITGRRVMDAEFGVNVASYLFEQLTEENALNLGKIVKTAIDQYEKRIDVINLNVAADYNKRAYVIDLTYRIPSYEFAESVFTFDTVLLVN
jgi:phage baseplate assembly protein W